MIEKESHNTVIQNAMIDCLNRQLNSSYDDENFILRNMTSEQLVLIGEFINSFYVRGGRND